MRIPALLCLVFFAGLTLGFIAASWRTSHSPAAPEASNSAGSDARAAESAASQSGPAEPVPQSLRDTLAALPGPPPESGSGVISGSVQIETGAPVSDVLVSASRDRPGRGKAAERSAAGSSEAELERDVLDLVERRRWAEATRRVARSDAKGEFLIDGLADAAYSLEASLVGFEIGPTPGESARGVLPGAHVRFVAKPSVSVPVTVLLPDGKQPDTAKIEYTRQERRGGSPKYAEWSPAEPSVRLEPGDYTLAAVRGEDGELRSDPVEVSLKAGAASLPITLQLRERPGIRGRVVFPPGEEMDANVFVQRWDSPSPPDYQQLLAVGNGHRVRRLEGFRYFFRDLAPGRYVVAATRVVGRVEAAVFIEVEDKIVPQDIFLPPLDAADYVLLWVRGPQGEALSDIDVSSGCKNNDGAATQGSASWLCRPDGSYWVLYYNVGLCAKRTQDLRYTLAIESRRYGKKEVEYKLPRLEPVIVVFTEPAFLDVFLSGYEGSGNEGFVMLGLSQTIRDEEGKDTRTTSAPEARRLDSTGRTRFGPLEPGTCELLMSLKTDISGSGYGGTGFQSIPFTLHAGENAETVLMPSLHSLTVLVEDPRPDTRLNLCQLMDSGKYGGVQFNGEPVGQDGRITFRRLPDGRYKISTRSGYRDGEMVVKLPEQATVRYEPRPRDAMYVYVENAAGALARAGLKTGDLIVGLDDATFEEEAQMQAVVKSAALKEEVTLQVLRGAERVQVRFDPRLQDKYDQLGGNFWPSCR